MQQATHILQTQGYGFNIKIKKAKPHLITMYNVLLSRIAKKQNFSLKLKYKL